MDNECDRDPILPRLPLPECYLVVGKVEQVRKKRLHRSLQKHIGDYSITFYVQEKTHIPAARFILTYDFIAPNKNSVGLGEPDRTLRFQKNGENPVTNFLTTILRVVTMCNIINNYPD